MVKGRQRSFDKRSDCSNCKADDGNVEGVEVNSTATFINTSTKQCFMGDSSSIFGLHADNYVKRTYSVFIKQDSKSSQTGNSRWKLVLNSYRFVKGEYMMCDGSMKPFEGHIEPMFFTLTVDTRLNFAEAVDLFKKLGFPLTAKITALMYDSNSVHQVPNNFLGRLERIAEGKGDIPYLVKTVAAAGKEDEARQYHDAPFLFGHLNDKFLSEINSAESILMVGNGQIVERFVGLQYDQSKGEGTVRRRIIYADSMLNNSTLDIILSASPLELSVAERLMLEEHAKLALSLDKA